MVARDVSNLGWPEFFLYAHMDPSSSSLRYGAIFNSHWFCGAWSTVQKPSLIAYKELFPMVVAASLWGSQWVAWQVEFLCDNELVVVVLKTGTLRDQSFILLLHYFSMLAIRHSFSFTASSVNGKDNPVADAISHFQFQRYQLLVPLADVVPAQIPASLLAALQMS